MGGARAERARNEVKGAYRRAAALSLSHVHEYAQRLEVDRLCEIRLETRRSRGARQKLFVVGHTALFGKALARATQEVQARHPRHGEMSLMINVGRYSLPRRQLAVLSSGAIDRLPDPEPRRP